MIVSSSDARRERKTIRIDEALARRSPASVTAPQAGGISLGKRLRDWKTLAGFGVSAVIVVFFVMTAHLDLGAVWQNLKTADVRYLLLAALVYFGAFIFRGLRWRLLLRKTDLGRGVQIPSLRNLIEIIYLSWFVNCIVPAKLGDGYRAYLLRKETGADLGRTLGTVVGERMADVLALVVLLAASGALVAGQLAGLESNLQTLILLGVGLAAAVGVGVVGLRLASGRLSHLLPERWRELFVRFVDGLMRTFRRDLQFPLYGLTCLVWACEALRIWLVMQSFHITGLALSVILFTALAGSLLSTIPFTPAGLGAVEGASVTILAACGVAASLAGAVAVMDRMINYWSNIPIGALLYLVRRSPQANTHANELIELQPDESLAS